MTVDPVKAFDTSVKDVTLIASTMATNVQQVRDLAVRMAQLGTAITTNYTELQKHLVTMVASAEQLKEAHGLKPDVAAELIRTFYSNIMAVEKAGHLDLVVKEMLPDPHPDTDDLDGLDHVEFEDETWAKWNKAHAQGYHTSCTECGDEVDMTDYGFVDDDQDAFCSLSCIHTYHEDDYKPSAPSGYMSSSFNNVVGIGPSGGNMFNLTCGALTQRAKYIDSTHHWKPLASGLGWFMPARRFKVSTSLVCSQGCGISFNGMEKGWLCNSNWYCSRSCAVKFQGDAPLTVPHWPALGIDATDWDPGYTHHCTSEHWLDYVLKSKPLADFPKEVLIGA